MDLSSCLWRLVFNILSIPCSYCCKFGALGSFVVGITF